MGKLQKWRSSIWCLFFPRILEIVHRSLFPPLLAYNLFLDGNITYVAGLTGSLLIKVLHSFGLGHLFNFLGHDSLQGSKMLETVQANIAAEILHHISLRHQLSFRLARVE